MIRLRTLMPCMRLRSYQNKTEKCKWIFYFYYLRMTDKGANMQVPIVYKFCLINIQYLSENLLPIQTVWTKGCCWPLQCWCYPYTFLLYFKTTFVCEPCWRRLEVPATARLYRKGVHMTFGNRMLSWLINKQKNICGERRRGSIFQLGQNARYYNYKFSHSMRPL
jgi:hypothetical protein